MSQLYLLLVVADPDSVVRPMLPVSELSNGQIIRRHHDYVDIALAIEVTPRRRSEQICSHEPITQYLSQTLGERLEQLIDLGMRRRGQADGAVCPNRWRDRSWAFRISSSRLRGGALVWSEWINRCAAAVTSSTARLNAASLAREGLVAPLSLRTNCSADARISSSVAGGAKLASVLMLRHMVKSRADGYRRGV